MDKYSEAIRDFTLLLAKGGGGEEIFRWRGDAFYKNKNYKEAVDDYNRVLYINPINLVTLNNLSFAYEALGDTSQALNLRQRVSEIIYAKSLDPDSVKFVKYTTPDSLFSIQLPNNFNQFFNTSQDSTIAYYMVDPVNHDNYRIGMKIIARRYEGIRQNTATSEDLLEKWRQSRDAINVDEIYRNDILVRRHKLYRDYPSYLTQYLYQNNLKSEPIMHWEYAIAYGLHLIEIYVTFPMTFYGYYSPIFEKSIDSFNIKMLGQF
jgi:tetratricopeptide (TPR) repeat protein